MEIKDFDESLTYLIRLGNEVYDKMGQGDKYWHECLVKFSGLVSKLSSQNKDKTKIKEMFLEYYNEYEQIIPNDIFYKKNDGSDKYAVNDSWIKILPKENGDEQHALWDPYQLRGKVLYPLPGVELLKIVCLPVTEIYIYACELYRKGDNSELPSQVLLAVLFCFYYILESERADILLKNIEILQDRVVDVFKTENNGGNFDALGSFASEIIAKAGLKVPDTDAPSNLNIPEEAKEDIIDIVKSTSNKFKNINGDRNISDILQSFSDTFKDKSIAEKLMNIQKKNNLKSKELLASIPNKETFMNEDF